MLPSRAELVAEERMLVVCERIHPQLKRILMKMDASQAIIQLLLLLN
jgi:hypothetical protein